MSILLAFTVANVATAIFNMVGMFTTTAVGVFDDWTDPQFLALIVGADAVVWLTVFVAMYTQ